MGRLFVPAALVALVALSSCASAEKDDFLAQIESGDIVITSNGPSEALRHPATFDYASGSTVAIADNRFDSFAIEGDLRGSLERQLRLRGLARGPRDRVDYLIGYRVSSADRAMMTDAVKDFGMRPRFQSEDLPLQRGAFLLAISDASSGDVVWRGAIEGAIDPTHGEKERRERIDRAVSLLLERL